MIGEIQHILILQHINGPLRQISYGRVLPLNGERNQKDVGFLYIHLRHHLNTKLGLIPIQVLQVAVGTVKTAIRAILMGEAA